MLQIGDGFIVHGHEDDPIFKPAVFDGRHQRIHHLDRFAFSRFELDEQTEIVIALPCGRDRFL